PVSVLKSNVVVNRSWHLTGATLEGRILVTNGGSEVADLTHDEVLGPSTARTVSDLRDISPGYDPVQPEPLVLRFRFPQVAPGRNRSVKYAVRVPESGSAPEVLKRLKSDQRKAEASYYEQNQVSELHLEKLFAIPNGIGLAVGQSQMLMLSGSMNDGTPAPQEALKAAWSSSRPDVAPIDDGNVRAVSVGVAILTARVGDKTAEARVTVTAPKPVQPLAAPRSRESQRPALPKGPEAPPAAADPGKSSPPRPSVPQFMSFPIPTATSEPTGVAVGPDGSIWFTEWDGNKIGKLTPSGTILEFSLPTPKSQPVAITKGPDDNLWFVEKQGGKVGRITPAGSITEFPAGNAQGIVAGPDGNLWFTLLSGGIGRITPAGIHNVFPLATGTVPNGITVGPDGNLWFTASEVNGNDKIGRITPSGTIKEFPIPTANCDPGMIVTGPDRNLWFTETHEDASKVGRITLDGRITEFTVPTRRSRPQGIVTGPDQNLWFSEYHGHKIGRITPAGAIEEFSVRPATYPTFMTTDSSGNLWFAARFSNTIVKAQIG
ncbi:MAG TPA: SMP-30/gluconolactonase/LRE family protein, partial [Acidimicrobiales bacterium]|nr:SMP-30/gluconolactonase/LRE family protein [Acidimicrobiales bacterium]